MQRKRTDEAIACYRRAIKLSPRFANAHFNLSYALQEAGDVVGAIAELRAALAIEPKLVEARMNLGNLLVDAGELDAGLAEFRKVTEMEPNYPAGQSNLLMSLHYDSRITPRQLFDKHVRFGKQFADVIPRMPSRKAVDADGDRRLRIGYLSPDFREHPIASFIAPVLASHDRQQFEIFAYADLWRSDAVTNRLRGQFDHWREVTRLNDEQVAQSICRDKIDVLVDLAGHTNGARPQLLARKPAPVQATWMGYPNTTGVAAVDYRISDAIADPPGAAETVHVEKLVRLPGCFLCFAPPEDDVAPVDTPAVANGHVTFGSFNRLPKVSDVTIELWFVRSRRGSRIAIDDQRRRADRLDDAVSRPSRSIWHRSIARGRCRRESSRSLRRDAGRRYRARHISVQRNDGDVRVALMGVPAITLAGSSHVSRRQAADRRRPAKEWAAASPDAYVELAVELATDLPRLQQLRHGCANGC